MVEIVIAVACIVLAIVNIVLVRERERLRHPRRPQMVYGEPDVAPDDVPVRKPEQNPKFVQAELDRVKGNLRHQFPKLSDSEVNRAAREIVEKARLTLARIP